MGIRVEWYMYEYVWLLYTTVPDDIEWKNMTTDQRKLVDIFRVISGMIA